MTPFQTAREELRKIGIVLTQAPAEYRVNYVRGRPHTEYTTDDLHEAVIRAERMAALIPREEEPLGPMGSGSTRKTKMYRHNRKVAARRRKRQITVPHRSE